MNEDKSSRYHRLGRYASAAAFVLSAAFMLALLASGASLALRESAERLASRAPLAPLLAPFLVVAVYLAVVAAANETLTLPLSVFRGFLLERRYDLTRQTFAAWMKDHVKAGALGLALALLLAEVVYFAIRTWPRGWWVAAALAMTLLTIVLTRLAPVVLLPIFYRFAPLQHEALRERLLRLADRAGAKVVGVYEWKLGDKTSKANAALAGLGATRRILLSDTLLQDYSEEEIEVILAHELSHHVHRDLWSGIALDSALTFAALYLADRSLAAFAGRAGLAGPADVAGLPLLVLAGGLLSLMAMPLANAVSRAHEYRADRYALDLTRNPDAFASAMRRLGAQNLAEEQPSRFVELWFYTHPPLTRRLAAARAWMPRPGPATGHESTSNQSGLRAED